MNIEYIESQVGRKLTKQELVDIMETSLLYMQGDNHMSVCGAIDQAIVYLYQEG